MRRTVRALSAVAPEQRLGQAIATLPWSAQRALATVADREDLPLVAGSWERDSGGCLVANVLRACAAEVDDDADATLDLRILALLPELSSRDLNRLVVAWDEAAAQQRHDGDPALRRLLRGGLAAAAALTGEDPREAGEEREDPRRPGGAVGGGRLVRARQS